MYEINVYYNNSHLNFSLYFDYFCQIKFCEYFDI